MSVLRTRSARIVALAKQNVIVQELEEVVSSDDSIEDASFRPRSPSSSSESDTFSDVSSTYREEVRKIDKEMNINIKGPVRYLF